MGTRPSHSVLVFNLPGHEEAIVKLRFLNIRRSCWVDEHWACVVTGTNIAIPEVFNAETTIIPVVDLLGGWRSFEDNRQVLNVRALLEQARSRGVRSREVGGHWLSGHQTELPHGPNACKQPDFPYRDIRVRLWGSASLHLGMFATKCRLGVTSAQGTLRRFIRIVGRTPRCMILWQHQPQGLRRDINMPGRSVALSSRTFYVDLGLWTLYFGAQHARDSNV